jgi:hypothetical protein
VEIPGIISGETLSHRGTVDGLNAVRYVFSCCCVLEARRARGTFQALPSRGSMQTSRSFLRTNRVPSAPPRSFLQLSAQVAHSRAGSVHRD